MKNTTSDSLKRGLKCGLLISATLFGAAHSMEAATKKATKHTKVKAKAKPKTTSPKVVTLPGGLKIQDLRVGKGNGARAGQTVTVHYRGTLTNGKEFDQSYKRGEPFSFQLGAGQVIQGWDRGVAGMRVGGKRKLIIPSSLGYGEQGAGADIPPNATLVFVVELLKIG